jgi:hypothetical protein
VRNVLLLVKVGRTIESASNVALGCSENSTQCSHEGTRRGAAAADRPTESHVHSPANPNF